MRIVPYIKRIAALLFTAILIHSGVGSFSVLTGTSFGTNWVFIEAERMINENENMNDTIRLLRDSDIILPDEPESGDQHVDQYICERWFRLKKFTLHKEGTGASPEVKKEIVGIYDSCVEQLPHLSQPFTASIKNLQDIITPIIERWRLEIEINDEDIDETLANLIASETVINDKLFADDPNIRRNDISVGEDLYKRWYRLLRYTEYINSEEAANDDEKFEFIDLFDSCVEQLRMWDKDEFPTDNYLNEITKIKDELKQTRNDWDYELEITPLITEDEIIDPNDIDDATLGTVQNQQQEGEATEPATIKTQEPTSGVIQQIIQTPAGKILNTSDFLSGFIIGAISGVAITVVGIMLGKKCKAVSMKTGVRTKRTKKKPPTVSEDKPLPLGNSPPTPADNNISEITDTSESGEIRGHNTPTITITNPPKPPNQEKPKPDDFEQIRKIATPGSINNIFDNKSSPEPVVVSNPFLDMLIESYNKAVRTGNSDEFMNKYRGRLEPCFINNIYDDPIRFTILKNQSGAFYWVIIPGIVEAAKVCYAVPSLIKINMERANGFGYHEAKIDLLFENWDIRDDISKITLISPAELEFRQGNIGDGKIKRGVIKPQQL